jgi:small subunit ribosomal protein S1
VAFAFVPRTGVPAEGGTGQDGRQAVEPAAKTMQIQIFMSDLQTSTPNTESFAALFEESLTRQDMRAGEVISAEVVRVDHNFVVVNAGLKSEAYIPIEEFLNDQGEVEVQAGDFVSVAIDALENGYGDTILSRDKAKRLASWLSLEKALDNNELVTGTITGKVKGGMTVMVNGIRAFLPGSLVDTRPVKDTTPYEGKTLEFRVIKLDRKRNNVVLSRRAVIEATQGEERAKLLETLKEGAIVNGVVKNITDYGAFVDLGGIDGLLHITDIAWRRVRHPSEVLSVGQEVTAKILKFDQEKNRVSLGIKQLGDDPWEGISRRYPSGTRLFGKVTNITDYGAFVEVESGIEGLVHVSEMDWTNKNVAPSKVVQLGDEVEVMVLEIDEDRRRISLGMKQCKPNCRAASTVWFTFRTCRGRKRAKKPFASTRRATKSKPWFWASTSRRNAFRWVSSSSKATRSATSLLSTTRVRRLTAWSSRSTQRVQLSP